MKYLLIFTTIFVLCASMSVAQDDLCPTIVDEALSTAAASCVDVGTNEVCFGHAAVDTVINCDSDLDFDSPGDTISLDFVCAMRLSPMQRSGEWGVARMEVQPSDSDDLISYVLFGDVEIQNAASTISQLEVWVAEETEIRAGPGSQYDALDTAAEGDILQANACNCTGNWLRVVLENGGIGWVSAARVSVLGEVGDLPIVGAGAPVYESMQAFSLRTGMHQTDCTELPLDGVLVQVPRGVDAVPVQVNGVEILLTSTIHARSQPGGQLLIDMLDGMGQITTSDTTLNVPAGIRVMIPLSAANVPDGPPHVEPYPADEVSRLPVDLLPQAIDLTAALHSEIPHIIGVEACAVRSGAPATTCPLYFVNPDGDAITRMEVEFVSAPMGDWTGSVTDSPQVIAGDNISGALAWDSTCSLGRSGNFIGPVLWSVTLSDEAGHVSEPFEASFNCVEG